VRQSIFGDLKGRTQMSAGEFALVLVSVLGLACAFPWFLLLLEFLYLLVTGGEHDRGA
jgi:hypothetical protein